MTPGLAFQLGSEKVLKNMARDGNSLFGVSSPTDE